MSKTNPTSWKLPEGARPPLSASASSKLVAEIRTAMASMRNQPARETQSRREELGRQLDAAKESTWAAFQSMVDHAEDEGRDFLASERRQYDDLEASLNLLGDLDKELSQSHGRPAGLFEVDADEGTYAAGRPLSKGQSFAGYTRARGLQEADGINGGRIGDGLSFDKYIRGSLTGNWRGADREREIAAAMSGASSAAGGVLIPTALSAQIIDLARAQTQVLNAGAHLVPMESRTVDIARWTQDPTLTWRTENAIVTESDAAVDKVTLSAKPLATVVRVSRELVEDASIGDALADAFAAAFALKIDNASLYADGTDGAPTGIKSTAAVTKTSMGTNGASMTSWDNLVDAKGRLRDANEIPNGQIMADRSARVLAKLKASGSGEYLAPPTYLDDVPRLITSGVPTNLTVGTSNDCSDVFTGDWTQLIIGVRTELQITILSERYMTNDAAVSPAGGQYGFMAWWRGDIVLARPKAFDVITGVRG